MEQLNSREAGRARRRVAVGVVIGLGVVGAAIAYFALNPGTQTVPPAGTQTPSPTQTRIVDPVPTRTSPAPVPTPSATPSRAPQPSAGPTAVLPELEPVDPRDAVEGEDGVQVALTNIESVQGQAVQPGEVSGPAIRVTVTLTNGSDRPLNTNSVVVNAYTGADRRPASPLVLPGGLAMDEVLASGASTYGIYIFQIPEDQRSDVTITVDYAPGVAAVVFRGNVG